MASVDDLRNELISIHKKQREVELRILRKGDRDLNREYTGRANANKIEEGDTNAKNADDARRLQSSVVSTSPSGVQNQSTDPAPAASVGSKRRAHSTVEDDPKAKRRNKKMFGALIGTLNKFKKENEQLQKSNKVQRREQLLQKARAKAEGESLRLREEEKEKVEIEKMQDVAMQKQLSLKAEMKTLDLVEAKLQMQCSLLSKFIQTNSTPPLYWCPKHYNDAADKLLIECQNKNEKKLEQDLQKIAKAREECQKKVEQLESNKQKSESVDGDVHMDSSNENKDVNCPDEDEGKKPMDKE